MVTLSCSAGCIRLSAEGVRHVHEDPEEEGEGRLRAPLRVSVQVRLGGRPAEADDGGLPGKGGGGPGPLPEGRLLEEKAQARLGRRGRGIVGRESARRRPRRSKSAGASRDGQL